jgi:23S rRNA (cytosine1962-C5)-methyltransferase
MEKSITVTPRGAERVRDGHLWIYRSDVLEPKGVTAGSVVRVLDERKKYIGQALFSDQSQITLRFLTTRDETIDREWWRVRIRQAALRRKKFINGSNAFRLIYSEGDLLPSLIVDNYGGVLVVQTLSQGMDAHLALLVELLTEEFRPRAIIERNDVRVRELEGLPLRTGVLSGDAPREIPIAQDGIRFLVSPLGGQKTGSFLDQRENRVAARDLAGGRALDCFTFNGGFALHLARNCDRVLGLDISADAITTARRNAELNGATNVEFREANVFDALHDFDAAGERFDTIVLDPPAFAKNRASVKAAVRGYKEINLRALKLLNPGGILVTCSCSYHMTEEMFGEMLADAARDAHRRVQLVEKRTQSSDHPILLGMPETYYLKCFILRVIE